MCDCGEGQRKNRFVFLNVSVYKAVKEFGCYLVHSSVTMWKTLKIQIPDAKMSLYIYIKPCFSLVIVFMLCYYY